MDSKKTSRRAALLGLGALAVAGCAASDPDDSGATPPSGEGPSGEPQAEVTPDTAPPEKAHFRKDGFEHFMRDALEEVSLTDAQRTKIDAIAAELRSHHDKTAKHAFGKTLATAIADGKLESGELTQAREAVLDSAGDKARAIEKALADLHATLESKQRAELVAALQRRMGNKTRFDKGKDWQARKSEKMARALDLDDAQLSKWREATASLPAKDGFADRRARMQAAMKTFVAADFD
ncbi:MAG TPA: Spy/CpxP family protein refolding chaperone, partial [Polyangiaceae bacterium]|nr:Spy/CpxP family protein refolding chaperone [Polyangiaceae bacterium]